MILYSLCYGIVKRSIQLNNAERQALLERLATQKAEMELRVARIVARRESEQRQLAEKAAELRKAFGTDDLMQVKDILEKTGAEHDRKLLACQEQMAAKDVQLKEIESALAQLDNAGLTF